MLNVFLICLFVSGIIGGTYYYFNNKRAKSYHAYDVDEDRFQIKSLVDFVQETFNDILKLNLQTMNISRDEYEKRMQSKNQLRIALKNCIFGDINAKNFVKSYIRDILLKSYKIDEDNIDKVIHFNSPVDLSIQDKFEILLYMYKKDHGYWALDKIISENGLDRPRMEDGEESIKFIITAEDIDNVYKETVKRSIHFEDKLNIVVQRVYQLYKGYSVVDEIRDMKIDGVSGGVSGIPGSFFQEISYSKDLLTKLPCAYDSVWIFFKGKTIHLPFLSFGSERELVRVCKNIYRYNNPGQLSETNGYMVNELKDGCRVVVARPPFCESWVFFVRKFDSAPNKKLEELIQDKNNQLPIDCLKWLIKGCRVTAVTGSQGTGKTTLLMSIVKFINHTFTLRIQEMAFELHLRKLYPERNIVSFRETASVSGQEGLDLQKKTDGTVNILGEVATAPVASWMIQMAQVASLFTIFTHHAKTSEDLVLALRNNLLQTRVFNNERVAEKQVADVVNFDVHLYKDINGNRYIQRITEIIPLEKSADYPDSYKNAENLEQKLDSLYETVREYFIRVTDRKVFETRDIIVWENGEYKTAGMISRKSYEEMAQHLDRQEREEFSLFLHSNWGSSYE
ncbi:MAG: Flp pilus assembly complex ATPase component TadA [Clostridiaceae bacterium]|nr:Flp pilus assembly complex ATPase component TadA [Clostridiaceae bacterium]